VSEQVTARPHAADGGDATARRAANKAVVVTGAAGFIGSNLSAELLRRGYTVRGVDNLSQGSELNIAESLTDPAFTLSRIDVRNETALDRVCEGAAAIVHLAAYKIPRYSDALDTLTINTVGTMNAAEAARRNGARLVAASTSDVYGKNAELPFREDSDLIIGPPHVRRWAYAISKMYGEQLLLAVHERYGIDVVLLRFFGGYGPNQHRSWWGGPQAVFIDQALDDQPCEIHGDGQQTRSFTYVSDHVDAIIRAIETPAAANQVFNIGSTREITIEALARLIWRLVRGEQEPKLKFIAYETFGRYEDVRRRLPDISQAQSLLGFQPRVDLEAGLATTIRWQMERRRELGIATPVG
jgi:UDP-glucose 4-epimerase